MLEISDKNLGLGCGVLSNLSLGTDARLDFQFGYNILKLSLYVQN
jgi:hypothetical protein